MVENNLSKIIILTLFSMVSTSMWFPMVADIKNAKAEPAIHVDIPVVLKKANVVFNMDHLAFDGDMPVGMKYMHLLANRFKEVGIGGQIIAIFHADVAYMTLNDRAYNAYRKISTGNPYKDLIVMLLKQGVQIEECAVSMSANGWSNEDLLPGVKVNAGAVGRIIQLGQEGYIQIQP
jgi:intracellular sulfur oxidation DsrE/DsrF family protein